MGDARRSIDSSTLDRVQSGDRDALAVVYEACADDVYRLAYQLTGSTAEAEDAVQDVFLGLPRALEVYEEVGKFAAWLKRVTVRTVLMRMRTASARHEAPLFLARRPLNGLSEETRLVYRVSLERALRSMPATLRIVFVLKEIQGFSHSEVADQLGITEGASTVRLHRARRFLRAHL